jgi:uroporphyrin-III C-methyltransferase/precorrin-2 dehydrogenase/sirohydrochlorin ferrochelatase
LLAFISSVGVVHIDAAYEAGHLDGTVMVFAASGDEALDRRVAEDARRLGIPVNAVDRPELCDFFTPALVNRAPVVIAIGTEGAGPVLAQMLRVRIDRMLSPACRPGGVVSWRGRKAAEGQPPPALLERFLRRRSGEGGRGRRVCQGA